MVIVYPDPLYPINPYPLDPYPLDPYPGFPQYPDPDVHWHYYYPKEEKKQWKEKHIKDVKKGIMITFEGDEEPLFIATDDACFKKIMKAIKE